MTPQLRLAVKLLRLSRMELRDMIRDEMRENPILEDAVAASSEQVRTARPPAETTDITPDVYARKVGDEYVVAANDDGLPRLRISESYRAALAGGGMAREHIKEKLRGAQWLIRSIEQRQRTIGRVAESILKFQREFLDEGTAHLKPLISRDVAEDLGMHESVVSLVATNKYVHTPQGIYELKCFFSLGSP
jgi:RNA polymerase sigma-54 factor